jgi:histone acetyltransferase 1
MTFTRYVANHSYFPHLLSTQLCNIHSHSSRHSQGSFETPGLKEYHARLQFFLLLYIEASSFIDSSDTIWQLLLIFERRQPIGKAASSAKAVTAAAAAGATMVAAEAAHASSEARYFTTGYTTLYKFFHFPSSYRLRLSQILILPPFQRRGHGKYLLLQVRLFSIFSMIMLPC